MYRTFQVDVSKKKGKAGDLCAIPKIEAGIPGRASAQQAAWVRRISGMPNKQKRVRTRRKMPKGRAAFEEAALPFG